MAKVWRKVCGEHLTPTSPAFFPYLRTFQYTVLEEIPRPSPVTVGAFSSLLPLCHQTPIPPQNPGFDHHHSPKPHPDPDFGSFLNIRLCRPAVLSALNHPSPIFIWKPEEWPLKTRIKRWDGVASLFVVGSREDGRGTWIVHGPCRRAGIDYVQYASCPAGNSTIHQLSPTSWGVYFSLSLRA